MREGDENTILSEMDLKDLEVGYHRRSILREINQSFEKGSMNGILGPNGSGKTTLLKTLMRILPRLNGEIFIEGCAQEQIDMLHFAKKVSAVLTDRPLLTNITVFEIVAMGRHPHTGFFGALSSADRRIVYESLEKCGADHLSEKMYSDLSDGEKQKVLVARALAQETQIILLDEPTSHLDIRYKIEILQTLRNLCTQEGKTVICTLHEPDLALKCCDYLMLVKNGCLIASGTVQQLSKSDIFNTLYNFAPGQFDVASTSAEFLCSLNKDVFLIGCDADTPLLLRTLSKKGWGIGIGILQENDITFHVARAMGAYVISVPAYEPTQSRVEDAIKIISNYKVVVQIPFPICNLTKGNLMLVERVKERGIPVLNLDHQSNKKIWQLLTKILEKS